jgi:hypothetical protein
MGTRASALMLREGLEQPPERLRGLVQTVQSLYRRALLRLRAARAAGLLADELAAASEVLAVEGREEAAHTVRSALVELEATVGQPVEAVHALRAALLRLAPLAVPPQHRPPQTHRRLVGTPQ